MKLTFFYPGLIFIAALSLFVSCQKDIDGPGNGVTTLPADHAQKVGTV